MKKIISKFTVVFENPFWVGYYERTENGSYEVARIVFGAEPMNPNIYDFIMKNFYLFRFTPSIKVDQKREGKLNPKRVQREVQKQMQNKEIGTKAQLALKLLQEQKTEERKVTSKEKRLAEKAYYFELKQKKKKEKHRGH